MRRLLIAAALAIALSFLADSMVIRAVSQLRHPYISYLMDWFTNLNTLIIVLFVMTTLFMWEEKKVKWIKVLGLSLAASAVVVTLLKVVIARARPMPYEGFVLTAYSFPSMHAALAFSVIPVLGREFPKLKWFWIAFAVLIAASRVYLGAHYLSDVVTGAALGYLTGAFFVKMQEKGKLKWQRKKAKKK